MALAAHSRGSDNQVEKNRMEELLPYPSALFHASSLISFIITTAIPILAQSLKGE
jgi:hypothetical protein